MEGATEVDALACPAVPPSGSVPPARLSGGARALERHVRSLAQQKLAEAEALLRQVDATWSPPPYDPFLVAQALGIRCLPVQSAWVEDAMIYVQDGQPTVLYRPDRPTARLRFSLFHEIAHTLFPDHLQRDLYRGTARPRLFEPEGQLEYLCDVAAAEFLMPLDLFRADLERLGFGADRVPELCQRYGASHEAVCLRMIEADAVCCCLALLEQRRQDRRRAAPTMVRVVYATPSRLFREQGRFLPPFVELEERSCVLQAVRGKKTTCGCEQVDLGRGGRHAFRIEAVPLVWRRRRHGRTPVLAFFYPA